MKMADGPRDGAIPGSALQPLLDAAGLRANQIQHIEVGVNGVVFHGFDLTADGAMFTVSDGEKSWTARLTRSFQIDWSK